MYIGLQGCSFLLRDGPDGYINASVSAAITYQIGPIPVAFIVLVACVVAGERTLQEQAGLAGSFGLSVRTRNRRAGSACRSTALLILGYVSSSLFAALGAVMLMAQIGVGDPQQGVSYTLSSITAVVLGGTSLRGGRGTFSERPSARCC